ncbi:MAG TPA: twin-arginine translocase TatA/TatE family subunit [Candidatus Sulfotelmatobacter sp.]|jgi:sec-independent protein translocase protein TatA|nr:twin-arginine translocase TatA/TatE family subunit [Candidatus Sulfotelmatobacter sp.]
MEFAPLHHAALLIFDSPMDIGLVVLIALILFGGKKIPELMRGLGQGIREFKTGMREDLQTPTQTAQVPPPAAPAATPATEEKK